MKEKYSFREFLNKETYIGLDPETEEEVWEIITKVEIPMIQRDYAQGRIKSQNGDLTILNDTGSRFLKSLFNKIKASKSMELEFIYGSVEERPIPKSREKEYAYIPLDGQQRLTTLFLLYWYFGMRELLPNSDERKAHLHLLSKFTYLTRTSSRIFCECICDWNKMQELQLEGEIPSKVIANCPWFYKEYKKDPTVKAILAMLDNIAIQYDDSIQEGETFLPRLEQLKFYVFPLNKYKLTEDLYIKMNARGKQLTGYENFKADLINWMKSIKNPESERFNEVVEYRGRSMKYYMAFAQKMDNEWTDIFWNTIKDEPNTLDPQTAGKTVDSIFMRFYIRLFLIIRILKLQKQSEITDEQIAEDEVVKYFYGEKGDDTNITYNNNDFSDKYCTCLSYDVLRKVELFLDNIKTRLDVINDAFIPSWQKEKSQSDASFYGLTINWQKRIILLAVFNYFTKNTSFDEVCFHDWMRIVWNFVVDPTIRNVKDNIGTLRFINDLSDNCDDIVSWLAANSEGQRLQKQYGEEHIKAKLIQTDCNWRTLLVEGEKHPLLKGRILFLLPKAELTTTEEYQSYLNVAKAIIPSNNYDFLWIRAILSQIDSFDLTKGSLTLSNIRENWKTSISDNLMIPMQSLIKRIIANAGEGNINPESAKQIMQELCSNYTQKQGVEWIYPLVAWQKDDRTLLYNYTYSQKIDIREGHTYLCYKTTLAPESCILLDSYRDSLITKVLPFTESEFEWSYTSYQCNIEDSFYRGMKVTLFRNVDIDNIGTLKTCYVFDAEKVIIGVRATDNPHYNFENVEIIQNWACSRVITISDIPSLDDIQIWADKIENDIFALNNKESLFAKVADSVWENDVTEEEDSLPETSRGLSVTFPDGVKLSDSNAIECFISVLQKIGLERISQLDVVHGNYRLVSKDKRPNGNWQREVGQWYVYSNISNEAKIKDLQTISQKLNLQLDIKSGTINV